MVEDPAREKYDQYRSALAPSPDAYQNFQRQRAHYYAQKGVCPPSSDMRIGPSNQMNWSQSTKIAETPGFVGSQVERNLRGPYQPNMQDTTAVRFKPDSHPTFSMNGVSEREAMEMHQQAQYAEVCQDYCNAAEGDGLI